MLCNVFSCMITYECLSILNSFFVFELVSLFFLGSIVLLTHELFMGLFFWLAVLFSLFLERHSSSWCLLIIPQLSLCSWFERCDSLIYRKKHTRFTSLFSCWTLKLIFALSINLAWIMKTYQGNAFDLIMQTK